MFPPPVVDIRPCPKVLLPADLGTLCPDPPITSPRSPWDRTIRRMALAGCVAGIALGMFVKVGVFAQAQPLATPARPLPGVLNNPPITFDEAAAPREQDLGTIPVTVVVSRPAAKKLFANPPPQGFKCHGEIMGNGEAVRVCRPDSMAASPIPSRDVNALRNR